MIQTFANTRIAQMGPWPQLDANLALSLANTTTNTTTNLFSFDNLALSIGASLAQTIFDGGAIDARVKIAHIARACGAGVATARRSSTPMATSSRRSIRSTLLGSRDVALSESFRARRRKCFASAS